MNKKVAKILAITSCACIAFAGGKAYSSVAAADKDVICDGIYVGGIDVSGMTSKQATTALQKYVKEAKNETVTVKIDDNKVTTTLGKLGYSCDVPSFVDKAEQYGKTGDIIKRYKQQKDLEQKDMVFELSFDVDSTKVKSFVDDKCTVYDVEAEDAKLIRKKGKFKIADATNGRVIVADETAKKIQNAIGKDWVTGGITVDAIMNDTTPKYDGSTLSECKDVLGTCFTSFASSDNARSQNLANAAKLLNGYTIYPGETFSVAEHLVPFTQENGYQVSKAYSNGQVVDSVGGGVCQAATTLYNALLRSELEIMERHNHSMIVAYVKPSMDAAISEGSKDLKFKNNLDTPIYLEAYTANRCIYFTIYGKETRDANRKVEYQSEVLETIQPGEDKVTVDSTKPEGYLSVQQSAHVGYKAKLWKIVYEDGKQVSKDQVNYSYYAAEPRYVVKGGTGKDADSDKKDEKDKKNKKEETADSKTTTAPGEQATATKAPVVTKAPVITKAPVVTKAPAPATKAPEPTKAPEQHQEHQEETEAVG